MPNETVDRQLSDSEKRDIYREDATKRFAILVVAKYAQNQNCDSTVTSITDMSQPKANKRTNSIYANSINFRNSCNQKGE